MISFQSFLKKTVLLASVITLLSCQKESSVEYPDAPENTVSPLYSPQAISTDKAIYKPNESVNFTLDRTAIPSTAEVRYKYQNTILSEAPVSASNWSWQPPSTDFRGYMVEVYDNSGNAETIYATIGVDVSSDWKKFPRYGFVSSYPQMSDASIASVVSNLNRYHLNGVQFYDWQNKHHKPLPMVGSTPLSSWKDIGNRDIYLTTVQRYITAVHNCNMKAMFYDLVYGAWDFAEADGVAKEWFIYNDNTHVNRDFFALSSPFLSNLYLLDPSNVSWQNYMKSEVQNVYQNLPFDGYHMDQVGDRGTRYKYDGTFLNLGTTFKSYIDAFKAAFPTKYNVLNAVNQYGVQGIATSGSDFMYTEVWGPNDSYNDLSNIIKQNNSLSNNTKNSVLAAYMNYDKGSAPGFFNTPSVLMTDAVIFAFGGAHIELGEHMLCKEYFPTSNLEMKDDLKKSLTNYYDFAVAYENILRDGGSFVPVNIVSLDQKLTFSAWPASQGRVAVFGKKLTNQLAIHLINFSNSTTQQWRDNSAIQVMPGLVKDAKISITVDQSVKKVWLATPDFIGGASRSLNYTQVGNQVSVTLPELRYWDMIVLEY